VQSLYVCKDWTFDIVPRGMRALKTVIITVEDFLPIESLQRGFEPTFGGGEDLILDPFFVEDIEADMQLSVFYDNLKRDRNLTANPMTKDEINLLRALSLRERWSFPSAEVLSLFTFSLFAFRFSRFSFLITTFTFSLRISYIKAA